MLPHRPPFWKEADMPPSAAQIAWLAKFLGMSEDAIAGNRALARQVEILEDMAESGRTFNGDRTEVDDGPADPAFDEPRRMPELDKGPMPDRRLMPMKDIKYTQNNVSETMSDGRPVGAVADTLAREGWDPGNPDPDMVANEHGGGTTLDHRRLVAAEEAGLNEVPAQVHGPDDPLPEEMEGRFKLKQDILDADGGIEVPAGTEAETWGEAARFRAANQVSEPAYDGDTTFADETYQFPPDGDTRQPYLTSEKAMSPADAAKAVKKAAKEAARIERRKLGNRADEALEKLKAKDPAAAKAIEAVKTEFDAAEARREADLDPDAPRPQEPEAAAATEAVPEPVKASSVKAGPGQRGPGTRGDGGRGGQTGLAPEPVAPGPQGRAAPAQTAPAPATEPVPAARAGAPMAEPAGAQPSASRPAAAVPAEPAPTGPKASMAAPEAEAVAGADAGAGAAVGAGAIGGLMAGGITLVENIGKVRSGQMSAGDAAKDAGAKGVEAGGLTYVGVKAADAVVKGAVVKGAVAKGATTAVSGAEGALAGAGADAAAAAAGAESAAVGAGAATAGAGLASVAAKGGVIGGIVAGGLALIDDVGKVRSGEMTGGTATVDVGVKTAVGVGAGLAGAAAGAEIGAIAGSVVPGLGNAVGFVAGAVIGGAVGYVGNKVMETKTGRAAVHAAGAAVDTAIHGVEAAGTAVVHGAEDAGKAVAGAAGAAVEGVEKAAGAVADVAGSAAHAAGNAASHLADGASSLFGKIKDAL